MAKQTINIGTAANAGNGDPIRTAFDKTNQNFTELYSSAAIQNLFYVNTAADPHNADVGFQAASFRIQGYDGSEQFRVETAANAVSYLIARGGIAGSMPVLVPGGAAADIPLSLAAKGLGKLYFGNGAGSHVQFSDLGNGATINWFAVSGNIGGSAPQIAVTGGDTDIDLALVPQGAGKVKFGSYSAGSINITADMTALGSVSIKDAGGTSRKLAVGA